MSGDGAFASKEKSKRDPFAELLRIEDNRRLMRFLGSGAVLGAAFLAYALTVEPVISPLLTFVPSDDDFGPDTTWVIPPPDIHRHGKTKPPKVDKTKQMKGERLASTPKSKHPSEETGTLGINILTSRRNQDNLTAYEMLLGTLIKQVDMEKIEQTGRISRTNPSRLSGRKGIQSTEYSDYYEKGTSDEPGGTGVVMPEGSERIATRPMAFAPIAPPASDIDFLSDKQGLRSTASWFR